MTDYDHPLTGGESVYDDELDETRTVSEVKDDGTVVWESGWTESTSSVAGNFNRDQGGYEVV